MCRLLLAVVFAYMCALVSSQFIRTLPQDYAKLKGEDVLLPCEVENSGAVPVLWRHGEATVAVLSELSGVLFLPNPNKTTVENKFSLRIHNLEIDDEGDYTCEISGNGRIVHKLTVNIPPTVELVPDTDEISVLLGKTVLLTCDAYGRPEPTIKWTRYGGLPNGQPFYEGSTLVLNNTGKMDTGYYSCEASNDAGIATGAIQVNVQYKPSAKIATEDGLIHGGPGEAVDIRCLNDGSPTPTIIWRHNDKAIDFTRRTNVMQQHLAGGLPEESILTFRPLKEQDFGSYFCFVNNTLGQASSVVQLTGSPYDMMITSQTDGMYSDAFTLTWEVRSHCPVIEYYVWMKPAYELPQEVDSVDTATDAPDDDNTTSLFYAADDEALSDQTKGDSDSWHKTVVPGPGHSGDHGSHENRVMAGSFTFKGLHANTTYLTKVQANNQFGDSEVSEVFSFTTSADGITFPPPTSYKPTVNTEGKSETVATNTPPKEEVTEAETIPTTTTKKPDLIIVSASQCHRFSNQIFFLTLLAVVMAALPY